MFRPIPEVMNPRARPVSSYNKPSSYATSPRLSRRVVLCHKATSTTESFPSPKHFTNQECQTDQGKDHQPLQRDYIVALRYINDCHEMMNQMYQQTRGNLRIPEVPNFIDMYMHFNGTRRNLDDIANQDLLQNISQTRCTLIDSHLDESLITNENDQDYSSPESDYELLAEPLNTYNKKQADIKVAQGRLSAKHVLQDSYPEESQDLQVCPIQKEKANHLDILYENNLHWKTSDHGQMQKHQIQSNANDGPVAKKPQLISSLEFENIVEELAQHAQRKFKNMNINQNMQDPNARPHSVSPIRCKRSSSCPYDRGETQETYDLPQNEPDYYETCHTQKHQPIETPYHYETRHQKSNHNPLTSQKASQGKISRDYQLPASKLLQKSNQCRADLDCHTMPNSNNNREMGKCGLEKQTYYKASEEVLSPNAFEKSILGKKKRSSGEIVRKNYSDSDIDDEYFQQDVKRCVDSNVKRTSCVNTTEENHSVVRPNRTELISTVKYGRKVVMRTELAPSEHPKFRQQRQSEERVEAKGNDDSSDICSDPEFNS